MSTATSEETQMADKKCVISREGITLFGYTVSWLVVVIIVAVLYYVLNKEGSALSQTLGMSSNQSSVMQGGSLNLSEGFNTGAPGQVRRMFGQ